jgi:UDP-N-acetyl-D-glucosamine dehydrogenase
MPEHALLDKFDARQARIGVIGLGYVGLPLLLAFAEAGFEAVGFDIDPDKIDALASGHSYIHHIAPARVAAAQARQKLHATTDIADVAACDAVIICVPTPLSNNREPDISYVSNTARALAPHLKPGQLIVLESTTYPGTTRGVLRTQLQSGHHLQAGVDFYLAFSPERADPANKNYSLAAIPKVVAGLTPSCLALAARLYAAVVDDVVQLSSLEAAEMTKLLENIFRSVNIALVNELKMLAQAMQIDIWEVIDAAATKPFGYMPFYPGPGLGGHCIPVDPFYLTWKAREFGMTTRFIELAGEINTRMPHFVLERVVWALNDHSKALRHSRIMVLGVAYKKDVDDLRESPALHIISMLLARGAIVSYHDPYVPSLPKTRQHSLALASTEITDAHLATLDAALIITDHSSIDYAHLVAHTPLCIDTRNATRDVTKHRERIVPA